mgnify:CR=1 FL=1
MAATQAGHFTVLEWLLENGCPCDDNVYVAAVTWGRYDIAAFLAAYGYYADQPTEPIPLLTLKAGMFAFTGE